MKICAEDCEVSNLTPTLTGFYHNGLSVMGLSRTGDCGLGLLNIFHDCEHIGSSFVIGLLYFW